MDFNALLKERYSVRKFADTPVEEEKIQAIIQAAQLAPTACNLQPQRILVIKSKEALEKLKECTSCHFYAPLAFLICYDSKACWTRDAFDGKPSGEVDASIVTTQMMLEVTHLGLGSTWVAYFDPEKVVEKFNVPADFVPVAILPCGYPAKDSVPAPLHTKRNEISQFVKYDTF